MSEIKSALVKRVSDTIIAEIDRLSALSSAGINRNALAATIWQVGQSEYAPSWADWHKWLASNPPKEHAKEEQQKIDLAYEQADAVIANIRVSTLAAFIAENEAIELIALGTQPTEPGWYVFDMNGERFVSELTRQGDYLWFEPSRQRVLPTDRIVARIYPDRIAPFNQSVASSKSRSEAPHA